MKAGKRVLHLIYDDFDNPWLGGGGVFRTWEVYCRFPPGWDLTVVTGNYPDAPRERTRGNIRYIHIGSRFSYPLSRLTYTLAARRFVQHFECDLLVDDFSGYSPCLATRYFKGPAVAIVQNIYGQHAIRHLGALGLIANHYEKQLYKYYRDYIVISQSIYDKVVANVLPGSRVKYIRHGVDERLLEDHDVPEEPVIFFLGRIDIYQKGLDTLIAAFEQLAPEFLDLQLVLAGSGSDERKLMSQVQARPRIADRVKMVGRLGFEAKRTMMRRCMCLCAPSRFESWNLVVLEASACRKPVVGSRITGLTETVREGETGILVPPENPKLLAEALATLIKDKDLRQRLADGGKQYAARFSWTRAAQEQAEFYRQLIEQGGSVAR
jgi:glycosyltransferase involved in cell wall biosynthesis